jgi:excisionase family DNA binding protein
MFQIQTDQTVEPMLLNPRQAAKTLGISERTLATYTKSGLIPRLKIGACVRYSPEALRQWIERAAEKKYENPQNHP